jgi:putative transcriptional regulator
MSKLGKRLIEAAREGRAIARGEADPATYRVHVPADIDVRKIRRQLGLSQDEFAAKFALPVGTVREWEQDRRRPEGAARVLLTVIEKDPDAVTRALTAAVHPDNTAEQSSQEVVRRSKAGGGVTRRHSSDLGAVGVRSEKSLERPRLAAARETKSGSALTSASSRPKQGKRPA